MQDLGAPDDTLDRITFLSTLSDRAPGGQVRDHVLDEEHGAAHPNVWLTDLTHPEEPTRVTANASHDDRPVFDPTGQFLYFRSNRGGAWGIWKIAVK